MDLKKLRTLTIAVLAGGESGERDVSLRSGQGVLAALQRQGLNALLVDPSPDLCQQLREVKADVVFNALHGGAGENGTIQALLELMRIPYTGSGVLGCALTMNKVQTKRIAAAVGIPSPRYLYFTGEFDDEWVVDTLTRLGLPAVTKPNAEGSSLGVTICHDEATLAQELQAISERYGDVLVDAYIKGTELTVGVLGSGSTARALPVLELAPKREFYDYDAKYTKGLTDLICPALIREEAAAAAQKFALRAHATLGCHGISRCDMHLDADGNLWFHEVNACPGMTETSDVPYEALTAGMSYDELVLAILESAFEPRRY